MSVTLRPMTQDEYERWLPHAKLAYAADIAQAGVDPEMARAKAERDFPALLPDGVATAGQDLFTLEADGEPVGMLWLGERETDTGTNLFVWDVQVDEGHRGRGFGKQAMLLAEQEARRRGIPQVALNVFGGNEVARNLYRSLGYAETAVFMIKQL